MDKVREASDGYVRNPGLRVPRRNTDLAIRLLRDQGILSQAFDVREDGNYVIIPLAGGVESEHLKRIQARIPDAVLETREFHARRRKPSTLGEILLESMPADLVSQIPRSFDFVGDIAIFETANDLVPYQESIGEAVMKLNPSVRAVFARAGTISGTERIRPLQHVTGENRTITIHREFGCAFKVDLSKVFFSPRLSTEHRRVAGLVGEGETVFDMFSGVGPFSILIAKNTKNVSVHAIDVNPDAMKLLSENAKMNKVASKVKAHLGDARKILGTLSDIRADRIIMNHPSSAMQFVDVACDSLPPSGGIVHYYTFSGGLDAEEKAESEFRMTVEQSKHCVKRIRTIRKVREVAPLKWQVVVDAIVIP